MFIKHYKYKINYTVFTLQFCYWKNIISYTRVFSLSVLDCEIIVVSILEIKL